MTINDGLFSSATDEWATPTDFFAAVDAFWHFTLDVCATPENAKCEQRFTKKQDGLAQSWAGERCWMNPPFGKEVGKWVQKAYEEGQRPGTAVVALLPVRSDTRWWQEWVKDKAAHITFLPGRLHFGGSKNSAPFPSALVVYGVWWPVRRIEAAL